MLANIINSYDMTKEQYDFLNLPKVVFFKVVHKLFFGLVRGDRKARLVRADGVFAFVLDILEDVLLPLAFTMVM